MARLVPGVSLLAVVAALGVLSACATTTSGSGEPGSRAAATSGSPLSSTPSGGAATPAVAPATSPVAPVTSPVATLPRTPATPANTLTVTVTASKGAPASSGPVHFPAAFAGTWVGHGRGLVIKPDGTLHVDFRTYHWCPSTPAPGCDSQDGNEIHEGGRAVGHLIAVRNDTTVTVEITASTVPSAIPLGQTRLGLDLSHHALALFSGGFSGVPFCSPESPAGYCGA